jgi:hypothetical protein
MDGATPWGEVVADIGITTTSIAATNKINNSSTSRKKDCGSKRISSMEVSATTTPSVPLSVSRPKEQQVHLHQQQII